ncbi:hypothetical protein Hanom_Chr04g00367331 [Helianthus anomalus]
MHEFITAKMIDLGLLWDGMDFCTQVILGVVRDKIFYGKPNFFKLSLFVTLSEFQVIQANKRLVKSHVLIARDFLRSQNHLLILKTPKESN